jgi:DNA-binding FadR family transcriptional regulator
MLSERHVTDDIAVLRTRHDEIGELSLPEPIRFAYNALSFHQLIVELTGNQTLAALDEVLNRIILHAYQSVTQDLTAKGSIAERNARSHAEHERLIGLIDQGDSSAAERHWREHCRAAAAASLGKGWRDVCARSPRPLTDTRRRS